MNKYFVLQRDFSNARIDVYEIEAPSADEAWEQVEEEISLNNSQEWLLTELELKEFQKSLCEVIT